jgi:hypothetical protein
MIRDELERIFMEEVVTYSRYWPSIYVEELWKTVENLG